MNSVDHPQGRQTGNVSGLPASVKDPGEEKWRGRGWATSLMERYLCGVGISYLEYRREVVGWLVVPYMRRSKSGVFKGEI